jgi:two-component system, LytTR family, sensor kinase
MCYTSTMETNRKGFLSNFIIYSRWYTVVVLTSIISVIIGFIISYFLDFRLVGWQYYLRVLLTTFILWIGCSTIVIHIWKKYPWILMPFKHLLMELVGVIVLLLLYFGITILLFLYENPSVSFTESIDAHGIAFIVIMFTTFFILAIHEAILFYNQWKEHYSKSIRLEKDTIEAQYNLLKTQINPHFLFNSLTSLMSLLEGNPKAEKYVQILSEYLRYVLMENTAEIVTIEQEIANVEKYFYLQKLRFDNNLHITIDVSKEALLKKTPPLVLQILVENCIKHNIISSTKPLFIRIDNNNTHITICNNLQQKLSPQSTGTGLKNIKGRYQFFTTESIKITKDNDSFSVSVPLL